MHSPLSPVGLQQQQQQGRGLSHPPISPARSSSYSQQQQQQQHLQQQHHQQQQQQEYADLMQRTDMLQLQNPYDQAPQHYDLYSNVSRSPPLTLSATRSVPCQSIG